MRAPARVLASLLIAGGFLPLAGCSPLAKSSYDSLRMLVAGGDLAFDASRLDPQVAYMRADVGSSRLLIGRGRTSDQGLETWYTASNQVLLLRDGLLERTVGLPEDLYGIRFPAPHPLRQGAPLPPLPARVVREVSHAGHDLEVSEYRLEDCGETQLQSWGQRFSVRCLREVLVSSNVTRPLPGNTYWVEPESGLWRKSLQWVTPAWPAVFLPRPGNPAPVASALVPLPVPPAPAWQVLTVTEPVRLSALLRANPLPENAGPQSAVWLSQGAQAQQQRLQRGVLYDLDQALAAKRPGVPEHLPLQQLRERVAAMPATGRRMLPPLQPRWLAVNPKQDPTLMPGDQLLRRAVVPFTLVSGLHGHCQVAFTAGQSVLQVLHQCLRGERLPDTVRVVDPQGQVFAVDVALWNRGDRPLRAGSHILLPVPGLELASGNAGANADLAGWLATQADTAGLESTP